MESSSIGGRGLSDRQCHADGEGGSIVGRLQPIEQALPSAVRPVLGVKKLFSAWLVACYRRHVIDGYRRGCKANFRGRKCRLVFGVEHVIDGYRRGASAVRLILVGVNAV